jgi:DNA-binding NarL/FixJ family response regulator
MVREGLRLLLKKDPDPRIVGEAGDDGRQHALDLAANVLSMPVTDGIELC